MGTKGDFYVGRGIEAKWLGSLSWDSYPTGLPKAVREAKSKTLFEQAITAWFASRVDAFLAADGWPWPWDTSHKTNYTYAFDEGQVWACAFGSSWWPITEAEPEHTTLKRHGARLPDMALMPRHPDKFVVPPPKRGGKRKKSV